MVNRDKAAQFGSNTIVGEDSNGNPYIEELTNGNRATLNPDGTVDTSSLSSNVSYYGKLANAPTDSEIGNGNVALYVLEGDDILRKRPYGGTESIIDSHSPAIIEDGANAQQKVDNNDVVRVSGYVELSSPLSLPKTTELYGWGYAQTAAGVGDCLVGNFDSEAVLRLDGGNASVFGIGIRNASSTGYGVRNTAYSTRMREIDVGAIDKGILLENDRNSDNPTEPVLESVRVAGNSGVGSGTIGVHNIDHHDLKWRGGIARGYEYGGRFEQSAGQIQGIHTYAHPASSYSVGLDIQATTYRVNDCRIEGGPEDAGILSARYWQNISDNLFQLTGGSDGIRMQSGGDAVLCNFQGNQFTVFGSTNANKPINTDPVNNYLTESNISNNIYDKSNFDFQGHMSNKGAGGAGNPPGSLGDYLPGQIVENTDDQTFWRIDSTGSWTQL